MNKIRKAVIALGGVWPKENGMDGLLICTADGVGRGGVTYIEKGEYRSGSKIDYNRKTRKLICTREQFEADAKLWRKESEVKYKFEPVIDLDIIELVRQHLSGEEFYSHNGELKYTFNSMLFGTIKRYLEEGKVHRRVECHWTDNLPQKCVVWDDGEKSFSISNVERIMKGVSNRYFDDQDYAYQNALPITGAETITEIEAMIAEAGE